ncbi:MAG: UDP-N-acetylglucosamine 2-epimerase (non-hydrolyzing) [Streptococcaceae bacterium]|jgi:UDP-N-acetylglucosamine 2-epimerase (non-hydrolysing)|nr:UDP-N-acetylglucosamine 2-epimerase (non-hydrolyzing) [Streptococcaceae bacterium]
MNKINVMTVFGTRPEAIKMAPIIKKLKKDRRFESIVVVTGQHKEMLDQVLDIFEITPDYDLNLMEKNQTLLDVTIKVMSNLDKILNKQKPDIVLVHGDTTTTFAASVIAFYDGIKIAHVEAGLRTWNLSSPFPEEMNRRVTDILADIYFAPTNVSKENLLKENHKEKDIFITGNTAIDSIRYTVKKNYTSKLLSEVGENKFLLVTMHRRENFGMPMQNVFKAINKIMNKYSNLHVIFPIHRNPKVRKIANEILNTSDRLHLTSPMDIVDFHNIAKKAFLILSDSGGVQEEAPSLGRPVLILRNTTERPEGVEAGALRLVGTDDRVIVREVCNLIDDFQAYNLMTKIINPYGDGFASERIIEYIAYIFGLTKNKPKEFEVFYEK